MIKKSLLYLLNLKKKYKIFKKFENFNKKFFYKKKSKNIILIEFNSFHSSHFFLGFISNYLARKFSGSIISYYNNFLIKRDFQHDIFSLFKWKLAKILNLKFFGIYRSLGVLDFIIPKKIKSNKINIIYNKIYSNLNSNKDILKIKIENIFVGDLIYDGYLKKNLAYKLDYKSDHFKKFLYEFIELYFYWFFYFKYNTVKAVVGTHSYYSYGLILRIALYLGLLVITVENGKIYKLSKKYLTSNLEFKFFKKIFSKLTPTIKKEIQLKSKISINNRFQGLISNKIDELVTTKSSFSKIKNTHKKILIDNNKINILIATHNIGDVSNAFGKNFFESFYEWLIFLGNLSKFTNYNWYIKDHPFYSDLKYSTSLQRTYELSKTITNKYKNIIRLNPNISHHQLIKNGVDYVLTVYGTIAWEYAYHNIPVLTASRNCPTSNYDFNIHSKNLKDYKNKILNLKKGRKKSFSKNEIIEFYSMRYVYFNHNNFYEKFSHFLNNAKYNWDDYDSENFYNFITKNFSKEDFNSMTIKLEKFLKNKSNYLL